MSLTYHISIVVFDLQVLKMWLGRDKIIVWFRLHMAQKVGSVGRENILFWTKILTLPVIINRVKWCKIRKSDITHTHTERS